MVSSLGRDLLLAESCCLFKRRAGEDGCMSWLGRVVVEQNGRCRNVSKEDFLINNTSPFPPILQKKTEKSSNHFEKCCTSGEFSFHP